MLNKEKRTKKVMKKKATKKRILIVNYEYPPLGGGGGVASHDLAKEWAKTCDVDVLTSAYGDTPLFEKSDGCKIYRVNVWNRNSRDAASMLSMFSYVLFAFFKGISLIRNKRYDIINTHFAIPSGPLGVALSFLFRIPNVLSIHGGDIYDPSKKLSPHRSFILRLVVKAVLNCSHRIVAQSSNTRDNAIKYYHPKKKIDIVPLAFHVPEKCKKKYKMPFSGKKDFVLVTIGRLVKRKAIITMIDAMANLRDDDVKLCILGDGPERSELQARVDYHNLNKHVFFGGFVEDYEKFSCLAQAKCFIMTSLHEGFGIVFMEAMNAGLPIISTNYGGQTDFLFNGKNAVLINVGDVEACAAAIKKIKTNKKFYDLLSATNKKDIKKFMAPNIAEQYTKIFKEIEKV